MLFVLGHLIWVRLPPCWLLPINPFRSTASSLSMTMYDNLFHPNQETSLGSCDPRDQTYFPISAIPALMFLHTFTWCDFCMLSLSTTSAMHTFNSVQLPPLHLRTADLHLAWLSPASSLEVFCMPSLSMTFNACGNLPNFCEQPAQLCYTASDTFEDFWQFLNQVC